MRKNTILKKKLNYGIRMSTFYVTYYLSIWNYLGVRVKLIYWRGLLCIKASLAIFEGENMKVHLLKLLVKLIVV